MNPRTRNLIQLNAAVLLWGGTALFAKTIALPVPHIILGRSLVAVAVLWLFMRWHRLPLRVGHAREGVRLGLVGVCLALHWVTYFHAIRISSVAVGIIALHTYPVLTALVEPWWFGERFRRADVAVAGVVLVGILILVPGFELANEATQGVLWGVVSAVFFAARNLLSRQCVQHHPSSALMLVQTAVTALLLLPYCTLRPVPVPGLDLAQLVVLGILFTALPQTLFTASLEHLTAKTVSVIASLLPIYGTLTAALLLEEWPARRTLVGGAIVLCAVFYETAQAVRRRP